MTPGDFLQWVPAGATVVCTAFLVYLFKDYYDFRRHTGDYKERVTREKSEIKVKLTEIGLELLNLKNTLELSNKTARLELERFKGLLDSLNLKAEQADAFFKKLANWAGALNTKVKNVEAEVSTIKVQMGETTIFKSKKTDDG